MVGGDFFQNETKVPRGQGSFHSSGGLVHEGLRGDHNISIVKNFTLVTCWIRFNTHKVSSQSNH